MSTLLIVYHSMTGGTLQLVEAAAAGARTEPALRLRMLPAAEASARDVLDADGYLFATPENLAAMSGQLKDFFDRSYYGVLERINGRPYGTLICAGSDGRSAAQQIARIALGWRLKAIAPPLIVCVEAQTPERIGADKHVGAAALQRCFELGATLSAGLALGVF
jgi:multimeric flavodoxin WrbA